MKYAPLILLASLLVLATGCKPPHVSIEYQQDETTATVCVVVDAEVPAENVSIETRPDGSVALCYTSPTLAARHAAAVKKAR